MSEAVDLADHDEEDVNALLDRETADGPGFDTEDELPPSDFDGFATEGVEVDA